MSEADRLVPLYVVGEREPRMVSLQLREAQRPFLRPPELGELSHVVRPPPPPVPANIPARWLAVRLPRLSWWRRLALWARGSTVPRASTV